MHIIPRFDLPKHENVEYLTHSSGGGHEIKYIGDIYDINTLRIEHGAEPFDEYDMSDWMRGGGIAVMRTKIAGEIGSVVGYAVSDVTSEYGRPTVLDVWVDEQHRLRGIAGYLIGMTLFTPSLSGHGALSALMYPAIKCRIIDATQEETAEYTVPCMQVDASKLSNAEVDGLDNGMPSKMTVLRTKTVDVDIVRTDLFSDRECVGSREYQPGEVDKNELLIWSLKELNK